MSRVNIIPQLVRAALATGMRQLLPPLPPFATSGPLVVQLRHFVAPARAAKEVALQAWQALPSDDAVPGLQATQPLPDVAAWPGRQRPARAATSTCDSVGSRNNDSSIVADHTNRSSHWEQQVHCSTIAKQHESQQLTIDGRLKRPLPWRRRRRRWRCGRCLVRSDGHCIYTEECAVPAGRAAAGV